MFRLTCLAVLAVCCLCLSFSACASSSTIYTPPSPQAQSAATVTSTTTPEAAFRDELGALSNLHGHFIGGPGAEVEALAAVTIVHVNVQLASPSLTDAQWDAFLIQHALWAGQEFTIPAGWEVSVQIFVPTADANSLGREIGVANLHTAMARQFSWDNLSPQQAWAQYDGTLYSSAGL